MWWLIGIYVIAVIIAAILLGKIFHEGME